LEDAIACFEEDLRIVRALDDLRGVAQTSNNLGLAYADLGDFERALGCLEESVRLSNAIGDEAGADAARQNLAVVQEAADLKPEVERKKPYAVPRIMVSWAKCSPARCRPTSPAAARAITG
jgi:tetratricopeptide (TPR) repeat protein